MVYQLLYKWKIENPMTCRKLHCQAVLAQRDDGSHFLPALLKGEGKPPGCRSGQRLKGLALCPESFIKN